MTTTDQTVPVAAVQIAAGAIRGDHDYLSRILASSAVTALAAAGWLHDPERVAALEAVAEAASQYRAMLDEPFGGSAVPELDALFAALDALDTRDGVR